MDLEEAKNKNAKAEMEIAHILEKLEAETGMNVNVIYPVRQYAESKLTVEPAEHIKVSITLTL